jgi:hypothetical protein
MDPWQVVARVSAEESRKMRGDVLIEYGVVSNDHVRVKILS